MKFAEWFEKQHGKRDMRGMPNITDDELRKMAEIGKAAEQVLKARDLWDEKRTSAMYAWNVKDEAKE